MYMHQPGLPARRHSVPVTKLAGAYLQLTLRWCLSDGKRIDGIGGFNQVGLAVNVEHDASGRYRTWVVTAHKERPFVWHDGGLFEAHQI